MFSRIAFASVLVAAASSSVAEASPASEKPPRAGVMMDVGAPDGAMASVVYRPVRALRLHGGVGHNLVSYGLRGGVTLAPLSSWATPTLSLDYGRYLEGDANGLARMVMGDATYSSPLLERVGYDFTNAHAGVELGNKRVSFFLRAGVSRVTSQLHGLDSMSSTENTSIHIGETQMTLWSLSGRMGLVFYLR